MKKSTHKFFVKLRFLTSIFFACFSSILFAQTEAEESIYVNAVVKKDIIYKTINDTLSLKIDLYIPKNKPKEKLPVVIQIHGGGWAFGDKTIPKNTFIDYSVNELINSGIAVASIQYRLVDKTNHFPSPIEDSKDAIKWVRKNAKHYHLDENKIGVWGNSAGAHLALLCAYSRDDIWQGDDALKDTSSEVNYVINNFGPTDLNKSLKTEANVFVKTFFYLISPELLEIRKKLIQGITELDIDKDKEQIIYLCHLYSPISYGAQAVPTLTLHGTSDRIVPFSHAKILNKTLKEHQIPHTFVIIKKGDHGFNKINEQEKKEIALKIKNFVLEH